MKLCRYGYTCVPTKKIKKLHLGICGVKESYWKVPTKTKKKLLLRREGDIIQTLTVRTYSEGESHEIIRNIRRQKRRVV
jgi:hypothetical protein